MKKCLFYIFFAVVLLTFAVPCWAGGGKDKSPAVSGLVGLEAALDGAALDIESKLPKGTPIVVAAITAPGKDARDYIADELSGRFKNLKILARDVALRAVEREQSFQLSGLVSDESAVGIGHYVGAQAVITGEFKPYGNFTQLRLRIVDVRTSEAFIYSARINNNDRLLVNILPKTGTVTEGTSVASISVSALDHLNRGKDYFTNSRYENAIQEFNSAISAERNLAEAYAWRGNTYYYIDNYDRAWEDFAQAIRIDPKLVVTYLHRGDAYIDYCNPDRAIADFTQAIQIDPNNTYAYSRRAVAHRNNNNMHQAIADANRAVQINPHFSEAYSTRGTIYSEMNENDKALADYTKAIQLDPDNSWAYYQRGMEYSRRGDLNRAISDWETALRLSPGRIYIKGYIDQAKKQQGR